MPAHLRKCNRVLIYEHVSCIYLVLSYFIKNETADTRHPSTVQLVCLLLNFLVDC